jgi:transposase
MITHMLNAQERRPLADLFQTPPIRLLRARGQALFMAAHGRRRRHIAEALGVSVPTLPRWLHTSPARGLAGLKIRQSSGRAAKLPDASAPEILTWSQAGPSGCGLDRATGTDGELATSLDRTKGPTVRVTILRGFGQRHAVRPDRPTPQDLKPHPEPQAQACQALQALENSRARGTRAAESSG